MIRSRSLSFPAADQVEMITVDLPEPAAHEIRCAARLSLVSTGTELACLAGKFDERTFWSDWVRYPFAPGYSMVSSVEAVGEKVEGIRPGDRVFSFTPHASAALLLPDDVTVLPDDVTDEQAVWSSLAVTTQWAVRRARFVLGEVAVVVGLGLLGQLLVRYLRIAGARQIIAIDTDAHRLELARAGGADRLIHGTAAQAVDELGGIADVVFDVTGHPAALAPASELLHRLGRLVLVGDSPRPSLQTLGPRIVADGISIIGVHAGTAAEIATVSDPWSTAAMLDVYLDLVRDGRMDPTPLLTGRIGIAAAPSFYGELQRDRSRHLGVVIDWSEK